MNLKPDIDSVKGIEEFKKHIGEIISQIEELDSHDETSEQMLTLLQLIRRLLEDKEEMMVEQRTRTSEEIQREFKDLTSMIKTVLTLDEIERK